MNRKKTKIILFIFGLVGIFVAGNLARFQVLKYEYYRAMAQGQQKKFQSFLGERGEIFFKGGEIIATNADTKKLILLPEEVEDKKNVSLKLSSILEIEEDQIFEKIENAFSPVSVKNGLTNQEIEEIEKTDISGIYTIEERKRFYPQRTMASQVVGFLGGENKGQYGLEGHYEEFLKGEEILKENNFLSTEQASLKGGSLILSLDYNIQFMAMNFLNKAKEELDIEGGTIIVTNPKTGAIMAMADFPTFDLNEYSKVKDSSVYRNSAVQDFFEPGSVFKPITMAGAIDQNKITPETQYLDTGEVWIGGRVLKNYGNKSFGKVTMTEVLEKSINTGAVFAGDAMGKDLFLKYLEDFGFFQRTGIDLQGEALFENAEFKKGYDVNYATASYGQGINITPIQLVRAFSSFANEGKITNPYIVEKTIKNGKVETVKTSAEKQVISAETASKVTTMLVNVIEKGFGKSARIPGYYLAGKTGTSQIPWPALDIDKRGYSEKTWQSFIGFAPAFNPQFLIFIKLDNPKAKTAEYSAMPIFRDLAEYIIGYMQIPPDYEI
ncbi:MAG: penicillin-binding protein 2 [Candidatus Pacebacteria bacterium]|nr:penicillin-binding protein 2 [Candidatus Paceibacterota bacterium]MDD3072519.1 penicillin-binding protein 2 [Candidatus Paceibacterota bacterium]MDD3728965.1 penicillin-binding protein 2 [Candidatus Paceibacterota bacterium]MDD4201638.1 penicillin-binding protein 2 [Candidatus Paceibacterota bacterium]MDD4466964.1 penicillin-binding protein 2 [Candidatus Paceibacterota bacterium]